MPSSISRFPTGITTLSWTAGKGNDEIVQLLLERKDISAIVHDNKGQTALHYAAMNGSAGVVNLLLGWENICLDIT